MSKAYSIAEARQQLPAVVHEAERVGAVLLTRRGKAVARLVSEQEYQRLTRRTGKLEWSEALLDTRGFRFDRDEANRR